MTIQNPKVIQPYRIVFEPIMWNKKDYLFTLFLALYMLSFMNGCKPKQEEKIISKKEANIKPPVASINEHQIEFNDTILKDNYFWLRDKENPEVIAYLEAENEYTRKIMADTEPLQDTIFTEIKTRIKEEDQTVPIQEDNYYYYQRTEKDKQYPIYCRKKGSLDAEEEIVIDVNQLAEGQPYFSLGTYKVSPDHQLVAYTSDTIGNEAYSLYVKNIHTRDLIEEPISGLSYAIEWANDNQTLFYTTRDEAYRPYKLFLHKLGNSYLEDKMVYHEEDDRYFLGLLKSKDKRYIVINLRSKTSTEVRLVDANQPSEENKLITTRIPDVKYSVYPHQNDLYILTNLDAVGFRLMKTPIQATEISHWQEVIPANDSTTFEDVEEFLDYLAVYKRVNGLRQIDVILLNDNSTFSIAFEDPAYSISYVPNPDFTSKIIRFSYSSLVRPKEIIDYNMESRKKTVVKKEDILGGYDPKNYTSERIFATANDGTKIPISLVYKKGLKKDGKNPLYLYGYGAYGFSTEPAFSPYRISLLDRGFIYAMAHIRGGGDMGEQWYLDGKLANKKNTFTDFIACAEFLQKKKYTNNQNLIAMGGSAGGLLIGAVANMRPDLFKILIARVPFVDVINTMSDETLPLTITEYEEWGNPNEKSYFDYIASYSPYENVKKQDYPHMLITAGLNDPRVSYWEPAKWTAKLRTHKTDDNRLLLKTNMEAGHGGASGRYDYIKEMAFEYAFILDILN